MIQARDTIDIIRKLFQTRGNEIATHLGIRPTGLSQIKSGSRGLPLSFDDFYSKIFDPNTEGSLAYSPSTKGEEAFSRATKDIRESRQREEREKKERYLLLNLRAIIEYEYGYVKKELEYCWDETDYKTFVMELLKRTQFGSKPDKHERSDRNNKKVSTSEASMDDPSIEDPVKDDTTQDDDVTSNTQVSNTWNSLLASEPVYMPDEFYKGFDDYAIADFIKLDPADLIVYDYILASEKPDGTDLIKKAMRFVYHIKEAMNLVEITGKDSLVCEKIRDFIKALSKYIDFLLCYSPCPNSSPFTLDPAYVHGLEAKAIRVGEDPDDELYEYDSEEYAKVKAEFERKVTEHRLNLLVLPEEVNDGEIIEIDDGLQPYYFYVLDFNTIIPLPYFRFASANQKGSR